MDLTAPSPVDVSLLRREVEIERRLVQLHRDFAIQFFQPHTKQHLFYENASFHFRYARTGNRFGKSEMGACEDIAFALGYRPWYPEGDPRRTKGIPIHPTKGLIVTTDWDKSTDVFTSEEDGPNRGKLFKYIPADCFIEKTRNHSGAIDKLVVRHISGQRSTIHLDTVKSFKSNPMGQESSSWDWIHVDEPLPEKMWKAVSRGLVDRGGRAWFTCTPLTEPWIDELFVPDTAQQTQENLPEISHDDCWMMTGSMYDNPHNNAESIERYLKQLSPEERECRISGRPLAYTGIVYKEFSWNDHVLQNCPWPGGWLRPPDSFCLRYAIDYHPRKPNAVLFIATSPMGISYVYAELWTSSLLEDFVKEIKGICPNPTLPAPIDPLASTPNKVTEVTFLQELARLDLPLIPATKDPSNGIIKVKQLLAERQKDSGQPVIFFSADLRRTLFEISRGFIWKDDTNEPVKLNDDMMENLYRLVLMGLDYVPPTATTDYHYTPPSWDDSVGLPSWDNDKDPVEERRKRNALRYRA